MLGSWLGITRSHRIRGWQGVTLSHKPEFTETNNWRLTYGPSYEGFGRRPFAGARAWRGAGVRKPRKEETAGRKGAVWLVAPYGNLRIADGSPMWRRGRKAAGVIIGSRHDGLFLGLGWGRRGLARRLESVCGGREDVALRPRGGAGGGEKRRCEAACAAMVMRCRS